MDQPVPKIKFVSIAALAAAVLAMGSIVAVASAKNNGNGGGNGTLAGYSKDDCKNGGWQNFKNPDGSPMFKNQGDCVSFFATGGKNKPSGS